jgi:protoheme IX farnesyltransferase
MKPDADAAVYGKPGARADVPSRLIDVLVLAKVRVNALVVATTAGGYYMAAPRAVDWAALAATCAGTALVASGAAAINQVTERDADRLMERTRRRPLAEGRMSVLEGRVIAAAMSAAGLLTLWSAVGSGAALVAFITLVVYAGVYTPLKRRTSLATVIGAVPGALPPIIGWVAAGGSLDQLAPWALFLIMFLWQLPHFLAIAWIYRDDYARAGMPMLSVVDTNGRLTGQQAALWAAALVPFSQLPFLLGQANGGYAIGAILLGCAQLALAVQFARHQSMTNARALFFGSIVYLPLLWLLLAAGRQ